MPTSVPVTVFFIGLFALIQIPLTVMVAYRRVQTGIQFLTVETKRYCGACALMEISRRQCLLFFSPWPQRRLLRSLIGRCGLAAFPFDRPNHACQHPDHQGLGKSASVWNDCDVLANGWLWRMGSLQEHVLRTGQHFYGSG